jgi:TLC ATP/ADP transporter
LNTCDCTTAVTGGFWLLDSLKDAVLERTVGLELQPAAKLLSVAVTLLLVIQYNRLVDRVRKHVLFYILGAAYTLLLLTVGLALGTDAVRKGEGGRAHGAWKGIGFASYVAIESYGSLTVALFWAFVNAAASLEEAKASYGLIIAGAQVQLLCSSSIALFLSVMLCHHISHFGSYDYRCDHCLHCDCIACHSYRCECGYIEKLCTASCAPPIFVSRAQLHVPLLSNTVLQLDNLNNTSDS